MKQKSNYALRSLAILAFCFLFTSSLTSCKSADVLGPLKEQALKLVTEHAGKLVDIKGKLGPLASKIGMIPDSIPGASVLKAALGEKQGELANVEALLGSAPAKIETAIKDGKKEDLTSLLGDLKGAGGTITGLGSFLTDSAGKVGDLEKLAAAATEAVDSGEYAKTLSTGYELKGSSTGVESMLIAFVEDDAMKIDKKTWFNFDRLTFNTGSANLDMEKSAAQLTNMSEIMKAYPKLAIKLGGYTDNTGKAAKNLKLSGERAKSVLSALVKLGVDAKRLESEGYGDAHAVCEANDTPECQAQNRRIAISVRAK